jgi:FXSXX-COOH protein
MNRRVVGGVVDRTTEDDIPDWQSPMVDVSDLSLAEIAARAGDTVLAQSLRRLADDLAEPGEPIAGFNSAL